MPECLGDFAKNDQFTQRVFRQQQSVRNLLKFSYSHVIYRLSFYFSH